jgi:hypothetical protein
MKHDDIRDCEQYDLSLYAPRKLKTERLARMTEEKRIRDGIPRKETPKTVKTQEELLIEEQHEEISQVLKRDRLEIEERNFRDAECLDGHGGRINVIDDNEDAQPKRGTVYTQMALRSSMQAAPQTSRNIMSQEGPRRNIFS